jgi:hypothetical protein
LARSRFGDRRVHRDSGSGERPSLVHAESDETERGPLRVRPGEIRHGCLGRQEAKTGMQRA